jgi:hypothetical protein
MTSAPPPPPGVDPARPSPARVYDYLLGSYLSVSHMTGEHKPPQAVQALLAVGRAAAEGAHLRDRDEVRRLFDGLEIVPPYPGAEPDVTWVGLWDCEDPALADSEDSRWLYCAVGKVTGERVTS